VNAVTAGALFQCLASPCAVCGYHLTLADALYCTTNNHFCVIRVALCSTHIACYNWNIEQQNNPASTH